MNAAIKAWLKEIEGIEAGKGDTNWLIDVMDQCFADIGPKWIKLKGIEPSDIVNGSMYIWDVGNHKSLVCTTLDGLITFHDDGYWPFIDNLAGSIYGPITPETPPN